LLEIFNTDSAQFSGAFREYLKERFIPSDLRSSNAGISERELLDTVSAQLCQDAEAKENKLTYYFIARMPEDSKAREQREAVLADLKSEFPCIAFLRLAGTQALNVELTRYGKLRNLLYEATEYDT